ncbi:hypothetical protein K449DRAFT_388837 [Hypoxylon sp. EC38]|nr:hypothetical protein K449DRAFT_388837 [Hypoxylon sp. EC38]
MPQDDIQLYNQEYMPQDDIQPYIQQNIQPYTQEDVQQDVQDENMLEEVGSFIQQNAHPYIQENEQPYTQQNVQPYVQENEQSYFQQNQQPCFQEDVQMYTQEFVQEDALEEYTLQNVEPFIQNNIQPNIQPQMGSYSANSSNPPNDMVLHSTTLGSFSNPALDYGNNLGHGEYDIPNSFTEPQSYPQYTETQPFSQYNMQQATPGMMDVAASGYASASVDNLPAYDESVVISSDPSTTPTDQEEPPEVSPKVPCDLCGKTYNNKECLRRHKLRVHKAPTGQNTRKLGEYGCEICGKTYVTADLRRIHRQRIHNPDSAHRKKCLPVDGGVTCPECPDEPDKKVYTSQKMLANHISSVHR